MEKIANTCETVFKDVKILKSIRISCSNIFGTPHYLVDISKKHRKKSLNEQVHLIIVARKNKPNSIYHLFERRKIPKTASGLVRDSISVRSSIAQAHPIQKALKWLANIL